MWSSHNKPQNWLHKPLAGIFCGSLAACSLLLAGCGFHLRGSVADRVKLPPTYLAGAAGPLQRDLRHYLAISAVPVVENRKDAQLVIDLIGDQVQRRVLSVGANGIVQEYEVHYIVTYSAARGDGKAVVARDTLEQQRSYTYSEAAVLAKDEEQEQLVKDMRRDVVRQMMLRLQAALAKSP